MNKVMRLVSIQFWAMFADILSFKSNKLKKSKIIYAGLVLFALFLGAMSFFYCFAIGSSLKMFDSIDILPPMMMAVTCLIVIVTTMNKVKGTIFGFKDYDMVMALPVSTSGIVASRLILLYAFNMVFVFIVMIPMMIAYGVLAKPSISFYLISSLLLFFIPLIPIIVASILGTAIAYAASKFRHSNLINVVVSFAFLIGFMVISTTTGDTEAELAKVSEMLIKKVNGIYPLASLYTKAVCEFDRKALLFFLAISVLVFLLFSFAIGKVFKKLNTSIVTSQARANYKMQKLKQATPIKALYIKELKRYFSSSVYVLNTGFGVVILTIGVIALCFIDLDKIIGEPQALAMISKSAPVMISFCAIMCCTTMASISLEGRSLWIIKSMPISAKQIFLAKIAVNLTIVFPVVIDSIILCFILKTGYLDSLFMILFPIACTVYVAVFGLLINLKLPNFTWTTETVVVKQSAATMIVVFTSMFIVGLPMIMIAIMPTVQPAYLLGGYTALLILVTIGLYHSLMKWGADRFAKL